MGWYALLSLGPDKMLTILYYIWVMRKINGLQWLFKCLLINLILNFLKRWSLTVVHDIMGEI